MKVKTELDNFSFMESYCIKGDEEREFACADKLHEFFDIKKDGEYIKKLDFILTKRKTKDSYRVILRAYILEIQVVLSDGTYSPYISIFDDLRRAIEQMGGECYIAVEG